MITARTHNVPAQPTTFGKRLAMFGEDLLCAVRDLDRIIENYPVRGLKGPVGTQMDLLTLFEGDAQKVASLESRILEHLRVRATLENVGQVYPVGKILKLYIFVRMASGLLVLLRLYVSWQVTSSQAKVCQRSIGSSAMPHKMNSRNSERLNGFSVILKGSCDGGRSCR